MTILPRSVERGVAPDRPTAELTFLRLRLTSCRNSLAVKSATVFAPSHSSLRKRPSACRFNIPDDFEELLNWIQLIEGLDHTLHVKQDVLMHKDVAKTGKPL